MKMLGGMFIFGRIAASHMTALQAHSQVYPSVSNFDAVFANVGLGVSDFDLVEMSAIIRHVVPPVSQRSRALRSHFASVAAAS